MRNEARANNNYYNQFCHLADVPPLKVRHKVKSNTVENIKIASKKLPPDFFRPFTRENPTETKQESGRVKTPCFGDDKKQSYSLSLIPREKATLEFDHSRLTTLPVQESEDFRMNMRRNCTRELGRRDQQYSHRHSDKRQLTRGQNQSTGRQKIKYKRMTLNDEVDLDENKKTPNLEYENRIRLNIKKFFQEDGQSAALHPSNIKTDRRVIKLSDKIPAIEDPPMNAKLKVKKLPPLL